MSVLKFTLKRKKKSIRFGHLVIDMGIRLSQDYYELIAICKPKLNPGDFEIC